MKPNKLCMMFKPIRSEGSVCRNTAAINESVSLGSGYRRAHQRELRWRRFLPDGKQIFFMGSDVGVFVLDGVPAVVRGFPRDARHRSVPERWAELRIRRRDLATGRALCDGGKLLRRERWRLDEKPATASSLRIPGKHREGLLAIPKKIRSPPERFSVRDRSLG